MKKLIFLLIIIIIVAFILAGCDSTSEEGVSKDYYAKQLVNFEIVYKNVNVGLRDGDKIVVDLNTGVMYYQYNDYGLCPIYNADGTLKIWTRKKENRD